MRARDYVFRGGTMPAHTADEIERYVVDHIHPGSFVMALMCDRLVESFAQADDENMAAMPVIVAYLYNHVPMAARGSIENVRAWVLGAAYV